VTGVGVWHYVDAGHAGAGYLGSAQVMVRSDRPGESILGLYDVFGTAVQASVVFENARCTFRTYSPGGLQVVRLVPPAPAFCGRQAAPANTMTCWVHFALTNEIVTATIPARLDQTDRATVLQALLTHLIAQT